MVYTPVAGPGTDLMPLGDEFLRMSETGAPRTAAEEESAEVAEILEGPRKRPKLSEQIMLGDETLKEFNQRLHREGRTAEFKRRATALSTVRGIKFAEARAELAKEYKPLVGTAAAGGAGGVDVGGRLIFDDKTSYWASLQWACSALGLAEQGHAIYPDQAPGPQAWAMYTIATKSPKDFLGTFLAEARKQSGDEGAGAKEAVKQAEEIEAMLEEFLAAEGLTTGKR